MNKSVRIIAIAIVAGVLAFAVFQITMYVWADNMFNKMFGGHLYSDYDNKVQQIKELQKKNEALLYEFNSR